MKWGSGFLHYTRFPINSIQASRGTKKPCNKIEKKVYPLRVQQRLNYMDVEVPDDDDFICKNWFIVKYYDFMI